MEIVACQRQASLRPARRILKNWVSTPEIRVDCSDETKFRVVAEVAAQFKKTHHVIDVDGVRVLFGEGMEVCCWRVEHPAGAGQALAGPI